jgi:hypothetical protein
MSKRKYLTHIVVISISILLTLGAFELAIPYVGRLQKIISVQKITSGWFWIFNTAFVATFDKTFDKQLTNAVPTKPASGIKAYMPSPFSAMSFSKILSKLYPNPKVLIIPGK